MSQPYVIASDGIAGVSAAGTPREEEPDANITIITDEGEPLYNRILAKKFAKGKLSEVPIPIHDEPWYDGCDVGLELDTLVTDIDPEGRTVTAYDGIEYDHDKLLLAAGGTPTQLPVENFDAGGIHHFWTFQDVRNIKEHIEGADNSVVIDVGLFGIGLTATTAAQEVGGKYLMRSKAWWRCALSEEGMEIIHEVLRKRDVEPVFDPGINHFKVDDDGCVTTAVDPNDDRYDADFASIAIGLGFNTEILGGTDIEYDNGTYTNEFMRMSHDDIFAAGDIIELHDLILGDHTQNGAWGSAKEQGAVVTRNTADHGSEEFCWVSSYLIAHLDFPFFSFNHPTLGDDYVEVKYSDTKRRRSAIKNGKTAGGVLIGSSSPQMKYKKLTYEQIDVNGQREILVKQNFQFGDLEGAAAEQ